MGSLGVALVGVRPLVRMELFHCLSTPALQENEPIPRTRSEDRDIREAALRDRRQSLPVGGKRPETKANGWSTHYEKKKSTESLERLTSRTLSPPPEIVPKYSRSYSVISNGTLRPPRHPELPPLNIDYEGPRLKDYLAKPRLIHNTRPYQAAPAKDNLDDVVPGLSKLGQYYNQTFLNVCDTCDSLSHTNPVSVLNSNSAHAPNRCMWQIHKSTNPVSDLNSNSAHAPNRCMWQS